ncbi:DUF928 domain-containing protein [Candidatus Gracilibacteria bacterium]|nr:DUF928 domain-containing protein [Candidatus Gracilibacteria bacterium]
MNPWVIGNYGVRIDGNRAEPHPDRASRRARGASRATGFSLQFSRRTWGGDQSCGANRRHSHRAPGGLVRSGQGCQSGGRLCGVRSAATAAICEYFPQCVAVAAGASDPTGQGLLCVCAGTVIPFSRSGSDGGGAGGLDCSEWGGADRQSGQRWIVGQNDRGCGDRGDAGSRDPHNFLALIPAANFGLTAIAHPTFWLYLPAPFPDVIPFEFVLRNEQQEVVSELFGTRTNSRKLRVFACPQIHLPSKLARSIAGAFCAGISPATGGLSA